MRHQHDCDLCKPLGEYGDADLYFCDQRLSGPTVIARYSDDVGDYQSGLVFADKIPALGEAKRRAIEAGYMMANAKSQATDAALSRQVACTDGLCPGGTGRNEQ